MVKRFVLLALLIIGIGIGIGVAGSRSGLASKTGPQSAAAKVESISNTPLHTDAATEVSVATSGSEADQLVQIFNAQSVANLKATWIHVQQNIKYDNDLENLGVMPNGTAIPNAQINDTWYHVDDAGFVIEVVSIMRTSDGQIVQVGVCSNNTSWNSATNETSPYERFTLDGFDYGFLKKDLQWLEGSGHTATIANAILPNGDKGIEVVIGAKYDEPEKTNDYNKPSIQAETRAVFDSTTGYLVSRVVTVWFFDGSQRVFSSMIQKVTFESPTDEVLNFLSEKNTR
jgi:hypothetical protein